MKTYLTYDDVNIVPKFSEVLSRENVDLSTRFTKNTTLSIPIVSSPMDTVTELNMAKEISGIIKLQIRGGAANPAPPVGPALGAKGVNIMEFCKQFNARTQEKQGKIVPVVITVYADKSFEFIIKTAPAASQLLEAAKKKSGSGEPNREKIATVTWDQIKAIAEDKMADLNAFKIESAMSMVAGTARSMGIRVKGSMPKN